MNLKSLLKTPIPACMQHLPKDERGFPIPVTVAKDKDGKIDFRVLDNLERRAAKNIRQVEGYGISHAPGGRILDIRGWPGRR